MPDALPGDRSASPGDPPANSPDASSGDGPDHRPVAASAADPADTSDQDNQRCDALADLPAAARASAAAVMRRATPEHGADIAAALYLATLLDRLSAGDADDRLADLAAARASGAPTATDRAVLARLDARMATDAALRARFDAFSETASVLHSGRADPAARFAALVAPADSVPVAGSSAPAARPFARDSVRATDRTPVGRVREAKPRWRVGVLAGLAVVAVAFAGLRVALPPRLDLGDTVLPEPSRSATARVDAPRAAYARATGALARAERTALGVSLGLDRALIAAAHAALDSVVTATPAASALHLDARFLRGAACEATGDVACARREFTAVVEGQGPRTGEAAARLAGWAR